MKIQIDTRLKYIRIEQDININDFFEAIKKLLPDDLWKEFELKISSPINKWNNPITIKDYTPLDSSKLIKVKPIKPAKPLPWINMDLNKINVTCSEPTFNLKSGVFNVNYKSK